MLNSSEKPASLSDRNQLSWADLRWISEEVFAGHESEGPNLQGHDCVACWCCDSAVLVESGFAYQGGVFCSEQCALYGGKV